MKLFTLRLDPTCPIKRSPGNLLIFRTSLMLVLYSAGKFLVPNDSFFYVDTFKSWALPWESVARFIHTAWCMPMSSNKTVFSVVDMILKRLSVFLHSFC